MEGMDCITDVAIMPNSYARASAGGPRALTLFKHSMLVYDDVWLARFWPEFAKNVMDACSVRRENFNPHRQFGGP